MSEPKFAECIIKPLNEVNGFDLMMNGQTYGHYPLDVNHDGAAQIKMAVQDAQDYGYAGIIFK